MADMGSLVISQVVSDLGQHTHHPIMVGGSSHQSDASESSVRSSREQNTPSTAARSASSTVPTPRARNSSAAQPHGSRRDPEQSSSTATPAAPSQPPTQEPAAAQSMLNPPHSRPPSHTSQHLNQHSRGFDQSGFPLSSDPRGLANSSPSSPRLQPTYRSTRSLGNSEASSPSRIKIRDLSHIQSFASEELLTRPRIIHRPGSGYSDAGRQYEISSMPVADIIEMVAGLLTKITTTNDQQHEHVHRPMPKAEDAANMSPQTSCVLAFHGKNVPSITILSYLSRIHKYCPTTYEVFLSLLVYFDRMTEMVNKGFLQTMRQQATASPTSPVDSPYSDSSATMNIDSPASSANRPPVATPPASGSMAPSDRTVSGNIPPSPDLNAGRGDLSQFFVVDSYNIHRLVIAAVTCASKFFSDVFYTNSRYAKVCSFRVKRSLPR